MFALVPARPERELLTNLIGGLDCMRTHHVKEPAISETPKSKRVTLVLCCNFQRPIIDSVCKPNGVQELVAFIDAPGVQEGQKGPSGRKQTTDTQTVINYPHNDGII